MPDVDQARLPRILVVDDNRAIHEDFHKILGEDTSSAALTDLEAELFGEDEQVGPQPRYRIDGAYQGEEALEKVIQARDANDAFDVAFVDMRMPPGWDGAETIERIWQEDPLVQIVLCTAYSEHSWANLFSRFGGRDNLLFLKKPFDNAEVQQAAAAFTEKRRLAERARLRMDELEAMVDERTAELREKEEQLRHRHKLEAIGSLAGGVAHEFNNLLQAISGYTKFAMEELPPDGEPYQDLQQVIASTERAAAITRQLLNFSRRQPAERTTVHLSELVSGAAEMLRPLLGEHIKLHVSAARAPTPVLADRAMMEQVLMNLCSNAKDAMPSGGEIRIATEVVTLPDRRGREAPRPDLKPGPYAVLSVADSGRGMTPDVLERIFDPFFTTKEVGKGTGLGLAMVHGTVQQHEGAIQVESKPGEGTTFEIYLPVERREAEASPGRAKDEVPGGTETILIAEDEPVVRNVAVRILEKAGYATVQAGDGEEAVDLLARHGENIALALLDVVMPKMSGRDVHRHIRQAYPHVKTVFCTGYDPEAHQTGFIKEVGEVEEVTMVEKPFSCDGLLRTVRELLDHSPASAYPTPDLAVEEAGCVACES